MLNIKKQIVPDAVANRVTYGNHNAKKYITIHQTGNISRGANAQMHAKLQFRGNSRSASWHYSVDDKDIIQSFEDDAQCWHAGDGRRSGNLNSIAIELCINIDGDYEKTIENGALLVKHLMDKYNLSIDKVKQHHDWSGKNCPAQIRANQEGISWNDFLNIVKGEVVEKPKPETLAETTDRVINKANLTVDGKWGNSTTRALQKVLGTVEDGYISDQVHNNVTDAFYGNTIKYGNGHKGSLVIKSLQRKVGSKADGLLGNNTVRALQRYLGTVQDGKLSRPSLVVKALQKRLNNGKI